MLSKIYFIVKKSCYPISLHRNLKANVLEVRNLSYLKKAMGWINNPILEGGYLHDFQYLEDLNGRRLRDAEVIGSACCNDDPKILLEIGTSHGKTTALMAQNAPSGIVYTVNIHPEEIAEGGKNVSFAPSREEIGRYYREKGVTNVRQIYANTKNWEPEFGPIDVAFIDGCHDADFVYNDTSKILRQCRSGSIIIWHDFAPKLVNVYKWIGSVCRGVEQLYVEGLISGRIFHVQDSWTGIYIVP